MSSRTICGKCASAYWRRIIELGSVAESALDLEVTRQCIYARARGEAPISLEAWLALAAALFARNENASVRMLDCRDCGNRRMD